MAVVTSCCCGCTLIDGTIGAGIIATVEGVLYMAYGSCFLKQYVIDRTYADSYTENFSLVSGICFVIQGLLLVFSCFLLFRGVKSGNRLLIWPWLVVHGITLVTNTFLAVSMFTYDNYFSYASKIVVLLVLVLTVYLHIVVVSFSQSLRTCNNRTYGSHILVPPQDIVGTFTAYQDHVKDPEVSSQITNVIGSAQQTSFPQPRISNNYLPQLQLQQILQSQASPCCDRSENPPQKQLS